MSKYTSEEVQKRFLALPPELREAISSINISDKIFDTAEKHGIKIDGMGALSIEVGYIMLGLTHPKDFVDQLASGLGVDKKSAQAIADDVNREIFYPVREHLRRLHNAPSEFPEPKLDTPASIFAEKMAGVSREPVKEVQIVGEDARKSHFLGEERLPGIPKIKAKDSFAELRAELQREIETEKGKIAQPTKPTTPAPPSEGGDKGEVVSSRKSDFRTEAPAYITEQRPSKAFALDEKESLPTPFGVGTPTSPPASVGAAPLPAKPLENGAWKSHFLGEERLPETKKPPAPPPATGQNNTGLLPAFRGYKMGSQNQSPTTPAPPSEGGDKGEVTPTKSAAIPPLPKSQPVSTPVPKQPQNPAAQPHNSGPDPYREPTT